jgi:hypothetical protein
MPRSNKRRRTSLDQATRSGKHSFRQLLVETLERRLLLATVTGVDPAANSHTAPVSTNVAAMFDQTINAGTATADTFAVHALRHGRLVGAAATVSAAGDTVTLDPASDFFPGETVKVTSTSGIQGASSGVRRVWSFRTGVTSGSATFVDSGQTALGTTYKSRLGDLDGDGDLDAYVLDVDGTNRIMLNDGAGAFTTSQTLGNFASYDVRLGDFDSDGDLDAFATGELYLNDRIWINDGTGQFAIGQVLADHASLSVDLGDLDGDGDLDAYLGTRETNRVLINDGNGNFSDNGQSIGNTPSRKVIIGDVDSDGDLDILSGNPDDANRLFLNNGGGVFTNTGQALGDPNSREIKFGDVDGDGDLDLLIVHRDAGNHVWLNDGSGVFTDSGQRMGDHDTWGGAFGDMDGDGDLDIIEGNEGEGNRVWLNDGSGVFTDSGQDLATGVTRSFGLGDLDGDGDLDAFTSNLSGSRIWFNQSLVPSVTLSADSTAVPEDGGVATLTATLSATHTAEVTVDLGFSGSAADTTDYTTSAAQITIPVGATSGSVTVTAVQDAVDDDDETVIVDITNVTNGQEAGVQQLTITILDDDDAVVVPDVTLSVDNTNIPEAAGSAAFTATLSEVTTVPVTVDLAVSGTADASDFTASGTQIVIAPGATTGAITVTAVDDAVDEPDETVVVDIAAVSGGNESGAQQQTTTITDDDEPPVPDVTLSVDNADIAEAAGVANFTVTLSQATTVPVTVDLDITGTAAASDYTASGTQVVVAPGATTGAITVTAIDDTEDESDETVIVDIAAVTGGNEAGEQQQTTTITDDDDPPQLIVTALTPNESGFVADFSTDVNTSVLNLYDTQTAGLGPADVVLQGASVGAVAGSLVIDPSLRQITFIKSGSALAPDTYTVTLRSAADGFVDASGQLLDGNDDGTQGDDYTSSFAVSEPAANAVSIEIADIVRGPGQDVNLPADATNGIPVTISEGTNIRAIDLRVAFDPALLTITGGTVGADAPAGASVIVNTTTPGLAIVVFFSTNPLPAGSAEFVNLQATVPATDASSIYGGQQILDLHEVIVSDGNDNEAPTVVDDAFHQASFFADVSGNGRINAADASGVARFAALIDSGFAGSPNADPGVVGDISGNGRVNAADASLLAQFAALINVPQIPAIPAGVVITGTTNINDSLGYHPVPVSPGTLIVGLPTSHSGPRTPESGSTDFQVMPDFYSQEGPAVIDDVAVDRVMTSLADTSSGVSDQGDVLAALEEALSDLLSDFD